MKIALIIIGELREIDKTIELNREIFKNFDLFIGGYKYDRKYYKTLDCNKTLCLSSMNYIKKNVPKKVGVKKYKRSMLQWHHLDFVIKKQEEELLKYDAILKIRTDTVFNTTFSFIKNKINSLIKENNFFYYSDRIFFSKPDVFIKVFKNYYQSLNIKKYPISEKALFNHFKSFKDINFNLINVYRILKINAIVRGDFVKISGEGKTNIFN